jgi:uncharacterized membrane protein HdeD (DUF308 family)
LLHMIFLIVFTNPYIGHRWYLQPNTLSELQRNPPKVRAVQIGLGALIIVLSILALVYPAATFATIIWLLAIVLLFVGIEEIIVGIYSPGKARWTNIGLGIVVVILAGLALSFPVAAAKIIVIIIAIAFLISGIARIIHGLRGHHSSISKGFMIGVGALAIVLSIAVLAYPLFGATLAGIIIAVGLLITGIQMVVNGVRGRSSLFSSSKIAK